MPLLWERSANALVSTNEKQFILKALEEDHRIDGRRPFDLRKLQLQISVDGTTVTALLGQTLVAATVAATIEPPAAERPAEGVLRLNVEYSPMAAPGVDASMRLADEHSEAQRLLEKALRDIRAVDLEALCIAAGRKVWRVQVDVRILDAAGNVTDAVFAAALAALMAFKRPEVSVDAAAAEGGGAAITVHSMDEREALPLSLHQAPLAVTFALFQGSEVAVVDPNLREEAAADGAVTVVVNAHGEVAALHKAGGLELSVSQILQLVRVAAAKKAELSDVIKAALEAHEAARVAARVRRRAPARAKAPAAAARNVATLDGAHAGEGSLQQQLGVGLAELQQAAEQPMVSSDEEEGEAVPAAGGSQAPGSAATEPAAASAGASERRNPSAEPAGDTGERGPMDTAAPAPEAAAAAASPAKPGGGKPGPATAADFAATAARAAGGGGGGADLAAAVKRKRKPKGAAASKASR